MNDILIAYRLKVIVTAFIPNRLLNEHKNRIKVSFI